MLLLLCASRVILTPAALSLCGAGRTHAWGDTRVSYTLETVTSHVSSSHLLPAISSQFLSILMVLLLCRQGIALPYLEPTPKRRKELSTYHTLQLDAREPWIDLQLDRR